MNKKVINKKIMIVALILCLLIPVLLLCGCGTKSSDYKECDEQRFVYVGRYGCIETPSGSGVHIALLVDKETRIIYMCVEGSYKYAITPLLDKNGNVTYYTGSLD